MLRRLTIMRVKATEVHEEDLARDGETGAAGVEEILNALQLRIEREGAAALRCLQSDRKKNAERVGEAGRAGARRGEGGKGVRIRGGEGTGLLGVAEQRFTRLAVLRIACGGSSVARLWIEEDCGDDSLHVSAYTGAVVFEDGGNAADKSGLGLLVTRC
ncbi:MAG: hypothetical protein KGN79_11025 [Acidobacteriota bacterium]|nr:hypothetical protein [Acidobacteriota bacterium]